MSQLQQLYARVEVKCSLEARDPNAPRQSLARSGFDAGNLQNGPDTQHEWDYALAQEFESSDKIWQIPPRWWTSSQYALPFVLGISSPFECNTRRDDLLHTNCHILAEIFIVHLTFNFRLSDLNSPRGTRLTARYPPALVPRTHDSLHRFWLAGPCHRPTTIDVWCCMLVKFSEAGQNSR